MIVLLTDFGFCEYVGVMKGVVYHIHEVAADDELFLIEGSCKTLEISLKNSNANEKLNLKTGLRIEIA